MMFHWPFVSKSRIIHYTLTSVGTQFNPIISGGYTSDSKVEQSCFCGNVRGLVGSWAKKSQNPAKPDNKS